MEINRVLKLKVLDLTTQDKYDLNYLMRQYRDACNAVSKYVFEHLNDTDFKLNSNQLSNVLYHTVKTDFQLKAQTTSSVFKTVTARYKAIQTQLAKRPYKYKDEAGHWQQIKRDLTWLQKPICFKRPQADLIRNRDFSFIDNGHTLSLQTLGQRLKRSFTVKHFEDYFNNWTLGTAKLLQANGNYYLHIAVKRQVSEFKRDTVKHVVGIDRGLRFLTTTFDEKSQSYFTSGKSISRKRQHYLKRRQILQNLNTKSAKRKLKKLSGKENRWMTDVNHQLSKTLIQKYGNNTLYVLEDLTNISFEINRSKQFNQSITSWSFYQLEQFLTYKAAASQSQVLTVDAHYTSQRCPKCGTVRKENRNHALHLYQCANCGYQSNDDRIGAMNIQELGRMYISGLENPRYETAVF